LSDKILANIVSLIVYALCIEIYTLSVAQEKALGMAQSFLKLTIVSFRREITNIY
jgi:hypothetical protein